MVRVPSGAAVFRREITDAISVAATEELAAQGYARLSMERVARRAGVSKSALYRRWPGKLEMVVELLADLSVPVDVPASTGTLRGDLRRLLHESFDWLRDPVVQAIQPDLLAESQRSTALAEATEKYVGTPRRAWARRFLEGSSVPPEALELVLDLVAAPAYWRLVHGRAVDGTYLDDLADLIVDGLGHRRAAR